MRYPVILMPDQSALVHQHCVPCEGGTAPLTKEEYSVYLPQVSSWAITPDEKRIEKEFSFQHFLDGVAFMNAVATLAESQGHHPDLFLHDFKQVRVSLWTHAIGGLSINDFVLATKIDQLKLPVQSK